MVHIGLAHWRMYVFLKQYLALGVVSKLLCWVPKMLMNCVGIGGMLRTILIVYYKSEIKFDSFCFACLLL